MKKSKRIATVGHIQSTSWSPFYVYYMSFRRSGSHKSNASNVVRIRAKMKKLWPLEANRTKLKSNFASCEITKCKLRNGHFQLAKFSQVMLQATKSTCVLPDICDQLFQIFSSDIGCLNPYFLLVIHQSQDSIVRK